MFTHEYSCLSKFDSLIVIIYVYSYLPCLAMYNNI